MQTCICKRARVVIILAVTILTVLAAGQSWEKTLVDTGSAGDWLFTRRAADSGLLLCYSGPTTGQIRIARFDTAWHYTDVESVRVNPSGRTVSFDLAPDGTRGLIHVSDWVPSFFEWRDASATKVPLLDTDRTYYLYPRLAYDALSRPTVAFASYSAYDSMRLHLGILDDSVWLVDTVHRYSSSWNDYYDGPLVIDRLGFPHMLFGIAYHFPAFPHDEQLFVASRTADSWAVRRMEFADFGGFWALALAVDSDQNPAYCYRVQVSQPQPYSHFKFREEVLDSTATVSALYLDSLNRPRVAYIRDGIVFKARVGGRWTTARVPQVHDPVSLAVLPDSAGQPIIAYLDEGEVWLAHGVGIVSQAEPHVPEAHNRPVGPTILRAPELVRFEGRVLDIQGRDVTEQKGALRPGVYFLRQEWSSGPVPQWPSVRKVILAR